MDNDVEKINKMQQNFSFINSLGTVRPLNRTGVLLFSGGRFLYI